MFAGRVIAAKGAGVLIRAVARLQAELLICGDGRDLEAMRRLARRLGIAERVHFTGWLAPRELSDQLAEASIVALPSVWPEPFGLVGIEALAAGRPAIASATGGVGDWLQQGVSGLMVPPGNVSALARALDQLLADPARQRTMGAAGKQTVAARFSQQRHLAVLFQAYAAAARGWQAPRNRQAPPAVLPARAALA
jgi:glycosyltransferase involved in cell wall biosynthesis